MEARLQVTVYAYTWPERLTLFSFFTPETVGYDDFIANGGFAGAKTNGVWRLEGKEYVVKEGDVLVFKFNV